MSSPPTRGSSLDRHLRDPHRMVLPAHAGVIPWSPARTPGGRRPPRSRGGHPVFTDAQREPGASSPPTRGSSPLGQAQQPGGVVLPAHAGVIRCFRERSRGTPSPPRPRGGHPAMSQDWARTSPSSPLTRGSSGRGVPGPVQAAVLPAHAGVIRAPGGQRVEAAVLPVHAGVIRRRCPTGRRRRSPPRPGGGHPNPAGRRCVPTSSSPLTRGSPGAPGAAAPRVAVLPAHAGVIRGSGR